MKSLLKICLLTAFVLTAGFVSAQSLKFGHIDTQKLMSLMPETKTAEDNLQKVYKDLQAQQTDLQNEYTAKLQSYLANRDSLSDVGRAAKEQELQDMQQRAENFNQQSSQQIQAKQAELMKPIVEKIHSTIEAVAKEQSLIYVFDTQQGSPVLYQSNQSIDLLPLCKAKMGIQ